MKDYYALLGIESNATRAEIKKNYRKLATRFHPDKNNAVDSAAKFIIITEAYDVLSNRKRRAEYDLSIWEKLKQTKTAENSFRTVVPPRETTRTRRNKAQRTRSLKYHQSKNQSKRLYKLINESLLIIVRYIPHMIGVVLAGVIINSAMAQISDIFDSGVGRGIGICLFMAGLVYAIFKIIQNANEEINKDLEAFAVFYRQPRGKLSALIFSVFIGALALIVSIVMLFN